ncbi:hypothetical protein [Thalassospira alkalitolerans]|uniref:capsular polysaccharide export protein, LipB/KpsS family n=1 Tax=Thalassospira alkalitolerans TaxID=1293890 RepID=UPI003AA86BAF
MTQKPIACVRNLKRKKKDHLCLSFERLLFSSLEKLGYEVREQSWSPLSPAPWEHDMRPMPGGSKILYEHLSRNQTQDGDVFYMEMYINGTFTLDHEGWGPLQASLSDLEDEIAKVDRVVAAAYCRDLSKMWLDSGVSKFSQPRPGKIAAPKGYLFVPMQLNPDDAIQCHSDVGVLDFLNKVAKWAVNRGVPIVLKAHPYEDDPAVLAAIESWTSRPNVYEAKENVHSLIEQSAGVITINSGCGFEALVHGKPVVTFGRSDYDTFTFRANGANLDNVLLYINSYAQDARSRAYVWVYYYLTRHVIDVRQSDLALISSRLVSRLDRLLTMRV